MTLTDGFASLAMTALVRGPAPGTPHPAPSPGIDAPIGKRPTDVPIAYREWVKKQCGGYTSTCSAPSTDSARNDQSEHIEAGNDVLRVLRGGSFGGGELFLRAADRGRVVPEGRGFDVGFGVVASRPRS